MKDTDATNTNTTVNYTIAISEDVRVRVHALIDQELHRIWGQSNTESIDENTSALWLLMNKLEQLPSNPVPQQTYFVNVYECTKLYGGPEEGGWYYTVTECLMAEGVYLPTLPADFSHILDVVRDAYTAFIQPEVPLELDSEVITKCLTKYNYFTYYDLDKYGEGHFITVAQQPGQEHDMRTQHYE